MDLVASEGGSLRRLDRYIWREMAVPFLIGTLAVVFMFQANHLIFLFKQFSASALPWTATAQLVLFGTPEWLNMTLPVGTSLGASLALTRLTRESELTAIRSAGTPILRVLLPVMVWGLLVAVANFYVADWLMPRAAAAKRSLMGQVNLLAGAVPDFKSNVSIQLQNRLAIIGSVSRGSKNEIQLSKIVLYEKPSEDTTMFVLAETGKYKDGIWTIPDYQVKIFQGSKLISASSKSNPMIIKEPVTIDAIFGGNQTEELPSRELKAQIGQLKRQGFDTRIPEIQYHVRFAVPVSCLVFALVAPIFGVYFARTGAFVGVFLSLIVVLLYYNAYVISTSILGPNGLLNPIMAAWLPNIIFFALGLIGLRRLE